MKITLIKRYTKHWGWVYDIEKVSDNGANTTEMRLSKAYDTSDEVFDEEAIKQFDDYVEKQKIEKARVPVTIKSVEI